MLPRDAGRLPLSLFFCMSMNSRLVSVPRLAGTVPVRSFSLRVLQSRVHLSAEREPKAHRHAQK